MVYKCKLCYKEYKSLSGYNYHLSNYHLTNYQNEDERDLILDERSNVVKQKFVCEYCNSVFSRPYNLTRHLKNSCKKNKKRKTLDLIKKMSDEDKQLILQSLTQTSGITTTTNFSNYNNINENSHNTNMVNISLNMVNVGNENLEMLEDDLDFAQELYDLLVDCLDKKEIGSKIIHTLGTEGLNKALLKIHKKVHCNENYPENHNIYVSNKKTQSPFRMFKDNRWMLSRFDNLNEPVRINYERLIHLLDTLIDDNDDIPEVLGRLQSIKDACLRAIDADHDQLKKDIFMETYLGKEMIGETYKTTREQKLLTLD